MAGAILCFMENFAQTQTYFTLDFYKPDQALSRLKNTR